MEIYFSLYEMMYNNICRHYKSSHIMTTNIVIIHENVYLLYETMYNEDKYFHYMRKYISHYTTYYIMTIFVVII